MCDMDDISYMYTIYECVEPYQSIHITYTHITYPLPTYHPSSGIEGMPTLLRAIPPDFHLPVVDPRSWRGGVRGTERMGLERKRGLGNLESVRPV